MWVKVLYNKAKILKIYQKPEFKNSDDYFRYQRLVKCGTMGFKTIIPHPHVYVWDLIYPFYP